VRREIARHAELTVAIEQIVEVRERIVLLFLSTPGGEF